MAWNRLIVWLAEGFGSGRLPRGPGTWGSLVGLGWFAVLLSAGSAWVAAVGAVAGVGVAVWVCGRAETILGRHDPGSIVLDEIVAVPLCFIAVTVGPAMAGGILGPVAWVSAQPWWVVPAGFAAFRCFDIWKPWPVRQIQSLPGGWGVVADDVAAAAWVNLVSLPFVV